MLWLLETAQATASVVFLEVREVQVVQVQQAAQAALGASLVEVPGVAWLASSVGLAVDVATTISASVSFVLALFDVILLAVGFDRPHVNHSAPRTAIPLYRSWYPFPWFPLPWFLRQLQTLLDTKHFVHIPTTRPNLSISFGSLSLFLEITEVTTR